MFVTSICTLLMACISSPPPNSPVPEIKAARGQNRICRAFKQTTVTGILLEVSVPEMSPVGAPVEMRGKLTNCGRKNVVWWAIDGADVLATQLRDARKQPARKTKLGTERLLGVRDEDYSLRDMPFPPGSCHTWKTDLNKFFKLEPGTYTLSASVEFRSADLAPDGTIDKSTVDVVDVPFRIIAPPKKSAGAPGKK